MFAIEGSTDAMTIIPADEVVSALNDGHVLEKAGYRVLSLTARFQPSTETPTAISTGSGTTFNYVFVIDAIVGGIAAVATLI